MLCVLSSQIFAMSSEKQILMGPILHFTGQDLENQQWQVSALYLLRHQKEHPMLTYFEGDQSQRRAGEVLGSKFGYDFVRYDMTIRQTIRARKIGYAIAGDMHHQFVVPALGQPHNILYHSCNGCQTEADRKKTGGIAPMWEEIERQHREKAYHVQFGGGDQIYADGLINKSGTCSDEPHCGETHGVFALTALKGWIHDKEKHGYAEFTEHMAEEVEHFYFWHYVRHYTNPAFARVMASVPSLAQPDDHDFFDGYNSYPYYLQQSFVMKGIGTIAMWYAFVIQHQLNPHAYLPTTDTKARAYHFLKLLNDGKLALYGVDTRTERTQDQVLSPDGWNLVFRELYALDENVEHIVFAVGVPVVYASCESLSHTFESLDQIPLAGKLLSSLPGLKRIFAKNAFGLFELADDLRDGWSHDAHIKERNDLIRRLQELADKKGVRVTIISGDVHLGGMGLLMRDGPMWQNSTIGQIISSPVGNITPSKTDAKFIGHSACQLQSAGEGTKMCLVKPLKEDGDEKRHALIANRNFVALTLSEKSDLEIKWSAEIGKGKMQSYYYTIPKAY